MTCHNNLRIRRSTRRHHQATPQSARPGKKNIDGGLQLAHDQERRSGVHEKVRQMPEAWRCILKVRKTTRRGGGVEFCFWKL